MSSAILLDTGISRDMIRQVLREQRAAGAIECQGRGPAARWRKKG
jgi:hypothetical protein